MFADRPGQEKCNFPNSAMLKSLPLLWSAVGLILPEQRTLLKWSLQLSGELKTICSSKGEMTPLVYFNSFGKGGTCNNKYWPTPLVWCNWVRFTGVSLAGTKTLLASYFGGGGLWKWSDTEDWMKNTGNWEEFKNRDLKAEERRPREVRKQSLEDSKAWAGGWGERKERRQPTATNAA